MVMPVSPMATDNTAMFRCISFSAPKTLLYHPSKSLLLLPLWIGLPWVLTSPLDFHVALLHDAFLCRACGHYRFFFYGPSWWFLLLGLASIVVYGYMMTGKISPRCLVCQKGKSLLLCQRGKTSLLVCLVSTFWLLNWFLWFFLLV